MRLIDADALAKKLTDWSTGTVEPIDWSDIAEAPTIDAVSVVRCKECKFCLYHSVDDMYRCKKTHHWFYSTDHFCSYGEREGE